MFQQENVVQDFLVKERQYVLQVYAIARYIFMVKT